MTHVLVGAETREKTCEAGETTGNKCTLSAPWENSLTSRLKMSLLKFRAKTKGCPNGGLRRMKMWDWVFLSEKLNRHQSCSEWGADGGTPLSQVLNSAFLGRGYFCLWLFGRPVTDTEAAPPSETPGARASVSDASLIRVGALISAFPPLSASPSVSSASEPKRRLHTWTASVSPLPCNFL